MKSKRASLYILIIIQLILFNSILKAQSNNIFESLISQIGGNNQIQSDYQNGKKWVAYFVAKPVQSGIASGGIKVIVDLADIAGITEEGKNGWTTVWIDVVASIGVDGWPIGFGVQLRSYGANAPDSPVALFDLTTNATVNSIPVDILQVNSNGDYKTFNVKLGVASPFSFGEEFSVHGLSFEIKKENLINLINGCGSPGISIANFAKNIILNSIVSGEYSLFNNPFINFRFTTLQDDPNEYLIQNIYSTRLVEGVLNTINVEVKVKESDNYHIRVWDGGGILYPDWKWIDKTSYTVHLDANESYTFTLSVTPDSPVGDFGFWLYQEDFLTFSKIIEKVRDKLYAAPVGTDILPPTISIINPKMNTTQTDSVEIIFDASDENSGLNRIDIFLEDEFIKSFGASQNKFWLNLQDLKIGQYNIFVKAYDNAGNGAQAKVTIMNGGNNIIFNSVNFDKEQYLANENAKLNLVLQNNLTKANVFLKIGNGSLLSCDELGSGEYTKSFKTPSNPGIYDISLYATKEGFQDAVPYQTTLIVNNPNIGHDCAANNFTTSRTNISPGQTITLTGSIVNRGLYHESNIPILFSLKDPNGIIINSKTDYVSLDPNESSYNEHNFSTASNGPKGYYTAEVRAQLTTDYDPSNNALSQSIFVGTSPKYSQYMIDFLGVLNKNDSYAANGYTHTLTWVGLYNEKPMAIVKVDKGNYSETKYCYENQLTTFDNNNYCLIYKGPFDNSASFNYGLPDSVISIDPNQLIIDAGTSDYYHVSSGYGTITTWGRPLGTDGDAVQDWLQEKNNKGTNFDLFVNVPLNAERKIYSFWPTVSITNNEAYAQILSLVIHEPHNISKVSLTPSNGYIDTIGKSLNIKGIFKNNGGYDENDLNIKLVVNGPNEFSYVSNQILNIIRNSQDTAKFLFNTADLTAGNYSISISAILPNDPYPDNLISSSIKLVNPPPPSIPVLSLPHDNDTVISIYPLLSWQNVSNADFYDLQVSLDNSFANCLVNDSNITPTQKQIGPLINNTKYFWRVKAENSFSSSQWSEIRNFATLNSYNIIGTVTYCNESNTPINNLTVYLNQDNVIVQAIKTNNKFQLNSIKNGNYYIGPITTTTTWGGVNSTDALLIRKYIVGQITISDCKKMALDVNGSGTITSLDPLLIRQRIVGIINSFPLGDWKFENPEVIINNSDINKDIKGICVGDVNGSYNSSLAKTASLININSSKSIILKNNNEFSIPLTCNRDITIGAITLFIKYPNKFFDFKGITSKAEGLLSNNYKDLIRIAWDDIKPLKLKAGENILEIKLKPKQELANKFMNLSIEPNSEFADNNGNVLDLTLNVPSIEYLLPKEYSMEQNYPNPFNPSSKIKYEIPEQSKVLIEVFNLLGERIQVLVNEIKGPGSYEIEWKAKSMSSGVYIYRMIAKGKDKAFTKVKKMILLK